MLSSKRTMETEQHPTRRISITCWRQSALSIEILGVSSLIEQRMKQREGDTQKANAALQNKIDSIMNNFQQEIVQDEHTAQSMEFKK